MHLGVLVLCKPSPLGGATRGRFTLGPIIEQPEPGYLLTSKDDFVIGLNKWGFGVMDPLPQTTLA
jgi:hypothetical protein